MSEVRRKGELEGWDREAVNAVDDVVEKGRASGCVRGVVGFWD